MGFDLSKIVSKTLQPASSATKIIDSGKPIEKHAVTIEGSGKKITDSLRALASNAKAGLNRKTNQAVKKILAQALEEGVKRNNNQPLSVDKLLDELDK